MTDKEFDKVYKVTKGNTDGSIFAGDLVYIDGNSGALVIPKAKGCLEKDEQTPEVMDFECEYAQNYKVYRDKYHTRVGRI